MYNKREKIKYNNKLLNTTRVETIDHKLAARGASVASVTNKVCVASDMQIGAAACYEHDLGRT